MSEYSVGQILLVANTKSFKIIPVQVVEEVIRTTIDGKKKTYMIMFPNKDKTVVDISDINFEIFRSEDEVKAFLLDNTRRAVEELIRSAHSIRDSAFAVAKIEEDMTLSKDDKPSDDQDGTIDVDLGNGTVAKMKVNDLRKVGQ